MRRRLVKVWEGRVWVSKSVEEEEEGEGEKSSEKRRRRREKGNERGRMEAQEESGVGGEDMGK